MNLSILKKSLLYRALAYLLGILIGIFSPMPIIVSVTFVTISEASSLALYYLYEHCWQKSARNKRLKEGFKILPDKFSWYNVLEVLEDNKFIIEAI